MMLIEIIGVPRDMLGEAERVTTYQFLRAIGIARSQGFDDVYVIADGVAADRRGGSSAYV